MQMSTSKAGASTKTQPTFLRSDDRAPAKATLPVRWVTPWSNSATQCCSRRPVQRLLAAKRDLRLPQELAKLDRFECVILDDVGYVQNDRDKMDVL